MTIGFTEIVARPDGAGPVPYTPESDLETEPHQSDFSLTWFKNGKVAVDNTNYIHVIGCAGVQDSGSSNILGLSFSSKNWTFIAVPKIASAYPPTAPSVRSVSEHELGHHVGQTDHTFNDPPYPAWCDAPGFCSGSLSVMDYKRDHIQGVDEFGSLELLLDDTAVRTVADPI